MNKLRELMRAEASRTFSDSDLARVLGVSTALVAQMREERRWLPRRKRVEPGSRGRTGTPRYRFVDTVACEIARIFFKEFKWNKEEARRIAEIVASCDKDLVRDSEVVVFDDTNPGIPVRRVGHALLDPEDKRKEKGLSEGYIDLTDGTCHRVIERVSVKEIVEAVANKLYHRMVELGFEFSGIVGVPAKKRRKRRS
jgi:hypothetical protein